MILDGKAMAAEIEKEIRDTIGKLPGRPPCLAVVLVGDDPASEVYVTHKKKSCARVGIKSISHKLPSETTQENLLALIQQLNCAPSVDGILVQFPFPPQVNPNIVMESVAPEKDVDGFHPLNMGRLLMGIETGFVPCTPLGIQVMLERAKIPVAGKHIVIVGRSNIVGKPLAALLIQRGKGRDASVTVVHRKSERLQQICASADILVTAMGQPDSVGPEMIKEGAVIVDVGISRIEDPTKKQGYRLTGDIQFDRVKEKCQAITPVPGGVGPMTIAMLLQNTLTAYHR